MVDISFNRLVLVALQIILFRVVGSPHSEVKTWHDSATEYCKMYGVRL